MAPSKTIPWRRLASPDAQLIYESAGTASNPDTATIKLSSFNDNTKVIISWGDGTVETLKLTTGLNSFSHPYTSSQDFDVKIFNSENKIKEFNIRAETSFKGDTSGLPLGIEILEIRSSSIDGPIANLPKGAKFYLCDRTDITGKTSDIPANGFVYRFNGTNLSGSVAKLPSGAIQYKLNDTSIDGQTRDLPPGADRYILSNTNVTGPASELPANAEIYNISKSAISGDLSVIRTLSTQMNEFIASNSDISQYTSGSFNYTIEFLIFLIDDLGLTASEVDNFLIDLNNTGANNGTLNIAGTNAARTSSSDAAVSALQSRGWSITVNT